MRQDFLKGMRHGIPVMLGYLSVSFGFGINAVAAGLSVLQAVGISLTNLTSAGQVAGVTIIAAGGSLIEMAAAQFIINIRYSLMGFSLSGKLSSSFTTGHRLITSFGITDENFAIASVQPEPLTPSYLYGLELVGLLGWVLGTFLGAFAGNILPMRVTAAMGLMLYGMFIAIIIPPAKKDHRVLFVILLAAGLSVLIRYGFSFISAGTSVIVCAVLASVIGAVLFGHKEAAT